MKNVSVSHFSAQMASYLSQVQNGEPIVLTQHNRLIAEVHKFGVEDDLVTPPAHAFSLQAISATQPRLGSWAELLYGERGSR